MIVTLHREKAENNSFYNVQETGLAKAMAGLGCDCVVLRAVVDINETREEEFGGIKLVFVPAVSYGMHCRFDWNIILRYAPDVIQINGDNQIFAPSLAGFLSKKKIPFYFYIGVTETNSGNKLKREFMKLLFFRNIKCYKKSRCFAKTPYVAGQLKQNGVEDVTVAPVCLDTDVIERADGEREEIRKDLDLPQDKKLLLFVGKLEAYKEPFMALKLLEELPSDYYLIMIGKGSLALDIERLIGERGLSDRVTRINSLTNKDVQVYYRACDYFVNFNRQEIFGMSILEAMYQGCTVIAVHAPGPDYIIRNGESGFLTENIEEMRDLIISNRKISPKCAYGRIVEDFTWKNTARIIYDKVVGVIAEGS